MVVAARSPRLFINMLPHEFLHHHGKGQQMVRLEDRMRVRIEGTTVEFSIFQTRAYPCAFGLTHVLGKRSIPCMRAYFLVHARVQMPETDMYAHPVLRMHPNATKATDYSRSYSILKLDARPPGRRPARCKLQG